MVSGLWQYRQRSGQPARNTVIRVPGPSTAVTSSHECTEPSAPARIDANRVLRSTSVSDRPAVPACARGRPRLTVAAHTAPWNVRESTSSCCSRVSRTKFTA